MRQLTDIAGKFFFTAGDGTGREQIWTSDGTPEGTVRVTYINPGCDDPQPDSLTEFQGLLYFVASNVDVGREIWMTDGRPEGTMLLINLGQNTNPRNLTVVGSSLFFSAFRSNVGEELWKTDGTNEGTVLVKDVWNGVDQEGFPQNSNPGQLTDINGTLYFTAEDGQHGRELWRSDGTPDGTVLVADIWPGAESSNPHSLLNVNGTVLFSADDPEAGQELWRSDGTPEGTFRVADIYPGPHANSKGDGFYGNAFNFNGTLIFSADDGVHGREPWALRLLPGDTNHDALVDLVDLANVRNNFGREGNTFPGDTTGDGRVNLDDLNAVRNNFGQGADEGESIAEPAAAAAPDRAETPLPAFQSEAPGSVKLERADAGPALLRISSLELDRIGSAAAPLLGADPFAPTRHARPPLDQPATIPPKPRPSIGPAPVRDECSRARAGHVGPAVRVPHRGMPAARWGTTALRLSSLPAFAPGAAEEVEPVAVHDAIDVGRRVAALGQ